MSGYISFPIASTPDEILAEAISYIKSKAPSWVENDSNLDTWILQILASEASDLRSLATDVPDAIFAYYGAQLFGITPQLATAASVDATWTVKDTIGYTIPAGTFVSIRNDVGSEIPFVTISDINIPTGETVAAGQPLIALNPGAAATALGGVGVPATLTDVLEFVSSVVLEGETAGGQDSETPRAYNDKLALRLRRLSTRPILPRDFSDMAREIAGVYRAVAIDGYDPLTQTYNNERMLAVSAVDENGNGVGSTIKDQIDALLEENREVNFEVNVIDPTYTDVNVQFTGHSLDGYDPNVVEADVIEALSNYLDKSKWGRDPLYFDTAGGDQTWVEDRTVRFNKMLKIAMNVTGVDYITTMIIGLEGGPLGTSDLTLPGAAPLARPGAVTGILT